MEQDFALMSEFFSSIVDPRKPGMSIYSADQLIFMTLCGHIMTELTKPQREILKTLKIAIPGTA